MTYPENFVRPLRSLRFDDLLEVLCWCEAKSVGVSVREVRRCMTRSCGAPLCEEQYVSH